MQKYLVEDSKVFNIVKALGIIAMVIGHAGSPEPLHRFIYLYHMALFFFISGYFFKEKYNFKILLKKRIKKLYLPFIEYYLIFLVLHNLFYKLNIINGTVLYGGLRVYPYSGIGEILKNAIKVLTFQGVEPLLPAFWFLTSLFTVNILYYFINLISEKFSPSNKESVKVFIIILFFVLGNLLTFINISLPRSLNTSFVAVLIFYLGTLYRKCRKYIILNKFIALVCIGLLILNGLYGKISMGSNNYPNPAFFLVCSICGIYLNIYLGNLILYLRRTSIIEYIGKNTLIIISLHCLVFKIVTLAQIEMYNVPITKLASFTVLSGNKGWWIIYSIVGVFVPLFVQKYVINKLKNFLITYKNDDIRKYFKINISK